MKRKISVAIGLFLVLVLVVGCATFKQNTYKTFYALGTTYDVAMKSVNDLKNMGKISDAQLSEIMKLANVYYVAYHAGVDAFETYNITGSASDQDKLKVALADIAIKLAKVVDYVNRLRTNVGISPIKTGGIK